MDHMMPVMDGVEATKIIRAKGIETPIIALTANAVAGAKNEYLAAGMNDLLTKPIKKSLLNKLLEDWLPPEKIIRQKEDLPPPAVTAGAADAADDIPEKRKEFWKKIEEIEGLSVTTGLERVSGQRDVFEKSLNLMMKEIEKCSNNLNEYLALDDMRNFCIEVHGMKGSLANIGMMELSADAYELEKASDKGDGNFCATRLLPFLDGLETFNAGLQEAFAAIKQSSAPVDIPPELPPVLKLLSGAFKEKNFIAVDEGMDGLSALQEKGVIKGESLNEEIEKIKDAVSIMDYNGANEIISRLL
jgi:CheY-like chemotaxis protein